MGKPFVFAFRDTMVAVDVRVMIAAAVVIVAMVAFGAWRWMASG